MTAMAEPIQSLGVVVHDAVSVGIQALNYTPEYCFENLKPHK
jgi:hypothetical protein